MFPTRFWLRSLIDGEMSDVERLWSYSQSWLIRSDAFPNGMVNHLTDVTATGGKRQMIHTSHFLSKGANVKIINCCMQLSWHG